MSRNLQPVTGMYHLIQNLAVNSELGVKTVDELIALSKAKPKTLSYLTASTPMYIYMEHLVKEKGADWVRVPFRGGGQALNAVLQGSTPIALIGEANMLPSMRSGEIPMSLRLNRTGSFIRLMRSWTTPGESNVSEPALYMMAGIKVSTCRLLSSIRVLTIATPILVDAWVQGVKSPVAMIS